MHEANRRIINRMATDLITQTAKNIEAAGVTKVEEVRGLGKALAEFSPQMMADNKLLKSFLMQRMYRHYKVNRMASKAKRVVRELFEFFLAEPECLPEEWRK